ncbi:hypothetical protein SCUCBS95973_003784 [Sporothrix curviconia]|uniref:Ima1 N-terminal domain-containing protein n=1 Tax=Sporothrix curviconia TaxID=1260050 RepID=A0ABP0BI91_9PEZI
MVRLRRTRYLSCFYCGRRRSVAYDGALREFACSSCDATNYLDENGDITDPPTSTTAAAEATTPFFASGPELFHGGFGSPGSVSSTTGHGSPGSGNAVFCKTCLKNQHLFISSLAQYFPSDPNHPDTPELERKYFRFRQGLEQRYPQVCADCEPRVLHRIREAGYTAKTDHLRRMVDYSRQVRLTRATPVDAASWIGRKLWWAGLVFQILWQVGVIGSFLLRASSRQSYNMDDIGVENDAIVDGGDSTYSATVHDPGRSSTATMLAVFLRPLLRFVVSKTDAFRSLCVAATLASCWWNPFLVQTVRGFTKPLIGIPTWYAHQAAILLVRIVLAKAAGSADSDDGRATASQARSLPPTTAGAHAVAALFILYLYTVAPRVIRKDLRPLFSKLPEAPLTPQKASHDTELRQQQSENRRRGLETMSDVLDEISLTPQQRHMQSSPLSCRDSDTDGWDGWQPSQNGASRSQQAIGGMAGGYAGTTGGWQAGRETSGFGSFGSLSLNGGYGSTTPAAQPPQTWSQQQQDGYYGAAADADEMDWTPTQPSSQVSMQSPHRAFNTYQPGASQFGQRPPSSAGAFSQTPVEADRGPFWYKVPPAPTSIAQRIFNRPNAPRLVQKGQMDDDRNGSPKAAASFFSANGNGSPGRTLNLGLDARGLAGASSSVEFAQPSFFAEDLQRKAKSGKGSPGAQTGDDDPGSFLSDLFSQTFSLGAGGVHDEGDGGDDDDAYVAASGASQVSGARQRAALHARRQRQQHSMASSSPFGHGGPSLLRRAATFVTTLASLAAVYLLREGIDQNQSSAPATEATFTTATTAAIDVFQYLQPYARLVEASAASLCATMAISLTGESIRRLRRSRAPPSMAAVTGLLLGLASIALACWMALQMRAMLQAGQQQQASFGQLPPQNIHRATYEEGSIAGGEAYGWPDSSSNEQQQQQHNVLPWPWWEVASLHGAVLVHQAWNMLVQ